MAGTIRLFAILLLTLVTASLARAAPAKTAAQKAEQDVLNRLAKEKADFDAMHGRGGGRAKAPKQKRAPKKPKKAPGASGKQGKKKASVRRAKRFKKRGREL